MSRSGNSGTERRRPIQIDTGEHKPEPKFIWCRRIVSEVQSRRLFRLVLLGTMVIAATWAYTTWVPVLATVEVPRGKGASVTLDLLLAPGAIEQSPYVNVKVVGGRSWGPKYAHMGPDQTVLSIWAGESAVYGERYDIKVNVGGETRRLVVYIQ